MQEIASLVVIFFIIFMFAVCFSYWLGVYMFENMGTLVSSILVIAGIAYVVSHVFCWIGNVCSSFWHLLKVAFTF